MLVEGESSERGPPSGQTEPEVATHRGELDVVFVATEVVRPLRWEADEQSGSIEWVAAADLALGSFEVPHHTNVRLVDPQRGCRVSTIRSVPPAVTSTAVRLGFSPSAAGARLWQSTRRRIRRERLPPDEASRTWADASESAARLGLARLQGVLLRNAANRAIRAEQLDAASCLLDLARVHERATGDLLGFVRNEVARAKRAIAAGRVARGLHRLDGQMDLASFLGLRETVAHVAGVVATGACPVGEWDRAQGFVERAIAMVGIEDASPLSAYLSSLLTFVEVSMAVYSSRPVDLPLALVRSERTARYYRSKGDLDNLTNELTNQAVIALHLGHQDRARVLLDETAVLDPKGSQSSAPFTQLVRGWLSLQKGAFRAAEAASRAVYRIEREKSEGRPTEWSWLALWTLARAQSARGAKEAAVESFAEALEELLDFARRSGRDISSVLRGQPRFRDEILEALLDGRDKRRAFELMALLQRIHFDLPKTLKSAPSPFDRLRAVTGAREGPPGEVAPASAGQQCWSKEARRERVPSEEERPRQREASVLDTWRGQLAGLALASDEGFMLMSERLGEPRALVLEPDGRILEHDPREPHWTRNLKHLRHLYIASLRSRPAKNLALHNGAALLSHHTVSVVPHFGVLARPPAKTERGLRRAILGTGTNFPTTLQERALAKVYGFRTEEGANILQLGDIGAPEVLYFSGHGSLATGGPWDAKIYFKPTRSFSLAAWARAKVPMRLAILSACRTAETTSGSSGEGFGFAEGLLIAGADTVLAAQGHVSATAALRFVTRFFEAGGLHRPAQAWRQTVLALRALGDPAWDDFVLFGRRGPGDLGASVEE